MGTERAVVFEKKIKSLIEARALLEKQALSPSALRDRGLDVNQDGVRRTAFEVLSYPGIDFHQILVAWPDLAILSPEIGDQLKIEATYYRYLERQEADVRALRRDTALSIGDELNYNLVPGLSMEAQSKLTAARPANIEAAARIPGVTPAAVTALLGYIKRQRRGEGGERTRLQNVSRETSA